MSLPTKLSLWERLHVCFNYFKNEICSNIESNITVIAYDFLKNDCHCNDVSTTVNLTSAFIFSIILAYYITAPEEERNEAQKKKP